MSPKILKMWIVFTMVIVNQQLFAMEESSIVTINAHESVSWSFIVTNTTRYIQEVKNVSVSCGCLKLEGDTSTPFLPGEIRPLVIRLNPQGLEGRIEKSVRLVFEPKPTQIHVGNLKRYTDILPNSDEIVPIRDGIAVLAIRAEIRTRLALKPREGAFGVVPMGEAATRNLQIALHGYGLTNAFIRDVVSPVGSVFDWIVAQDRKSLSLGPSPNRPLVPGIHSEIWKVQTTDVEVPEIPMSVSIQIVDGLSVSPRVVEVSTGERVCSRQISIRKALGCRQSESGENLRVLSAATKPRPWGNVRIEKRPLGGWRILIDNIKPDEVRQFSKAPFVEIKTSLNEAPKLLVPLRIVGGIVP